MSGGRHREICEVFCSLENISLFVTHTRAERRWGSVCYPREGHGDHVWWREVAGCAGEGTRLVSVCHHSLPEDGLLPVMENHVLWHPC